MRFEQLLTDSAVLADLGRRLARHRVGRNWTQAELALRAGVGQATVQRVERGESVQMTSMLKLLRALELLDGLDAAIPASIELPIAQLEREQHGMRQRARPRRGRAERSADTAAERSWRWGDEAQAAGERPGEGEGVGEAGAGERPGEAGAADERPGASEGAEEARAADERPGEGE